MCGIAGVLHKADHEGHSPIGRDLMTMSRCLQHRGVDSAGFAIFGAPASRDKIQVSLPSNMCLPEPQIVEKLSKGYLTSFREEIGGFAATLTSQASNLNVRREVIDNIERGIKGSVVTSIGSSMVIHKTVGEATRLDVPVRELQGSHGIAHLRLATESRIDPAHAQPFWGRPYSDIAVTHNGHITNYYKQREKLEARGFTFASKNDSEIIGILIGETLSTGVSLQEALQRVTSQLDGSFSFIVATSMGLGVARDPFATKPLLYTEQNDVVAIASEQQALHHLLGEEISIKEIDPRECRTWAKA
jgi:methylamine---glutamate N-methyltransferase subunit A